MRTSLSLRDLPEPPTLPPGDFGIRLPPPWLRTLARRLVEQGAAPAEAV